jgi:hypothetical protein
MVRPDSRWIQLDEQGLVTEDPAQSERSNDSVLTPTASISRAFATSRSSLAVISTSGSRRW